jgi:MoxR-like ATPase
MGVMETNAQSQLALTDGGQGWASRIDWEPESLPPEIVDLVPLNSQVVLPELAEIIDSVGNDGHFPADLVARLHTSLWSHPRRHFAILTGLSGSGKTLLARAYAKALAQGGWNEKLFTLPVQPGWYDPGALLGFTNPLRDDSYVRTAFLEFLMAAAGDPERAYVAVLDEMNLSHPEQYMAPLLSAMETDDAIQLHAGGESVGGVPESIPYPPNLVLIGTVNMDETTHGLSDKVLDRAFVLEFWEIDLDAYPKWGTRSIDPAHEGRAREVLTALMQALSPARLHFGWRVVDDVLDFLSRAAGASEALSFESALDSVIYGKVLPKLRGEDAPRFRAALASCEEALKKFGLEGSRAKIVELQRDLETTGSARFWR